MGTLERAVAIAAEAHSGQVGKAGVPYLFHPLILMLKMSNNEARIVAVLHDVVEDSNWTLDQLRKEGFSELVLEAVNSVTKKQDETYEEFVLRAGTNSIGRSVKLADLKDNCNLSRIPHPTQKDRDRIVKYERAILQLKGTLA